MKEDSLILFTEINRSNYIFTVGKYDINHNFELLEKIVSPIDGINENKFTNIDLATEVVRKNLAIIEKKLNYVFKEVHIIIDIFDYTCINISGFKRLNQTQILKDNISYILNSLKLIISENEKNKTILHIFNSKNILDGTIIENLPIGLFGDFYNHELTFFLINNNNYKNINQIFKKNNLNVEKVLLKDFVEGVKLINQNQTNETFFNIKIEKNNSQISFFDRSSFRYSETFNFGTNIILKDIEKVCAINNQTIKNIMIDKPFKDRKVEHDEIFEKSYFTDINFRKIRKKLIFDIADSRIEEIIDIIINKNINLKNLIQKNCKVYLNIYDNIVLENFKEVFLKYFLKNHNFQTEIVNFESDKIILNAAKLSFFGWKKEAIPITQTKNSLITRIFNSIFN